MTALSPTGGVIRGAALAVPVAVVGLIAILIVPLPPLILDLLISLSIASSLVVLLNAVHVKSPVQFSVFPSLLLLLTVFRLGLNIASSKRILLHGAEGTAAAGHVIEAFGEFVVGGNIAVGLAIFLVLLAVQFIVINHGATRISEVAARFTLDALPGKQMSVDADLNAGLIDEKDARARRKALADEASFYGTMDGAVRFTQRDAVASIIIVAINLIAGFAVGVLQAGLSAGEAIRTYAVLTVGDGLVTAMPALLVSLAGGLVTTRADSGRELSADIAEQILADPRPSGVAAGALALLALVPGLPGTAFLALAAAAGATSWSIRRRRERDDLEAAAERPRTEPPAEEPIEPLLAVDPLTIEVGYDLVGLAGNEGPGGLLERIRALRRQIALDLGLVVPSIRVRDNLRLGGEEYQILLRGAEVGRGRLPRGRVLAIDPGDASETLEGEKTLDPAFGIEVLWIREEIADRARAAGFTVVDRTSVLATHLAETVRRHAQELLGRQETQKLLDALSKTAPKLVEELVPERFTLGQLQKVLQALLRERVPIRDLQTIAETMADAASSDPDFQTLVARVRQALARSIVRPLAERGTLRVVSLSADAERDARAMSGAGAGAGDPLDPRPSQSLLQRLAQAMREMPAGASPVVLCGSPESRASLRKISEGALPTVTFLSPWEIPDGIRVHSVGQVR